MKIAFLGGTRFIGLAAAKLAREHGHEVSLFHRGVSKSEDVDSFNQVILDRQNPDEIKRAIQKISPDVLIDCFAMTESSAKVITEVIDDIEISKTIILSSQDVYAQFGRLNGHEFDHLEPLVTESSTKTVPKPFNGVMDHAGGNDYDKKDVELIYSDFATNKKRNLGILRLPAVYGFGDYQMRFSGIINFLNNGNTDIPCQQQAAWKWTHGHVNDMAYAIVLLAEKLLKGISIYNVGEAQTPSMKKRVEIIAKLMKKKIAWHESQEVPDELSILRKKPNDFVVDSTKIRNEIGYQEIISTYDAYSDTVKWIIGAIR
ncbi:MAG: NAD-dependent epimerase/dehydratase family protein [Bdellovibrionaceae bacterium]|nr:NAD-dependent epimerase/dehydratase family protein [Pseudobdellovibrionaceae bacterium]NUM57917.1 NAD-dependent epimerase/dehydratase family protein [Pseudobdellovibrionaceae bacterium]